MLDTWNTATADLGTSDIANLTVRYFQDGEIKYANISMGSDGYYEAYLVNVGYPIDEPYRKVLSIDCSWFEIIDDMQRVFSRRANILNVYRAGEFGIILQYDF